MPVSEQRLSSHSWGCTKNKSAKEVFFYLLSAEKKSFLRKAGYMFHGKH